MTVNKLGDKKTSGSKHLQKVGNIYSISHVAFKISLFFFCCAFKKFDLVMLLERESNMLVSTLTGQEDLTR